MMDRSLEKQVEKTKQARAENTLAKKLSSFTVMDYTDQALLQQPANHVSKQPVQEKDHQSKASEEGQFSLKNVLMAAICK